MSRWKIEIIGKGCVFYNKHVAYVRNISSSDWRKIVDTYSCNKIIDLSEIDKSFDYLDDDAISFVNEIEKSESLNKEIKCLITQIKSGSVKDQENLQSINNTEEKSKELDEIYDEELNKLYDAFYNEIKERSTKADKDNLSIKQTEVTPRGKAYDIYLLNRITELLQWMVKYKQDEKEIPREWAEEVDDNIKLLWRDYKKGDSNV